jgi:hypothetical protein
MPADPDNAFVPLTHAAAPAPEHGDFRVTVLSPADRAASFQPLGSLRTAGSNSTSANAEPRLTVDRDGDRISVIRLQCTCGQTHELACSYEVPAPETAPPPPAPAPTPAPDPAPDSTAAPNSSVPPALAAVLEPAPPAEPAPEPEPASAPAAAAAPAASAPRPRASRVKPRTKAKPARSRR